MELLMGVVAVVVVLAMALAHVSAGAVRRQLVGTPRTPISRVTDGVVRISGKITVASELLQAPLSGRTCVGYLVEDGVGLDKRTFRCRPFWIDDGTGRALVEPGDHFELAPDPAVFTERVGSREGVIQEGDTVTVNGHAVLEPHPGGAAVGARTTPMCPVLHAAGPHEPLLIAHDVGRARRP